MDVAHEVRDHYPVVTPIPSKKKQQYTCERCSSPFLARPQDRKRGKGRFCGRRCASLATVPPFPVLSGKDNPNWKGGLTKSKKGYWYVRMPDHPRAMKNGYVKRADLVLEEKLGRSLLDEEIAHHVNENKEDDSPENLEAMFSAVHSRMHGDATRKPKKPRVPDHPNNRRYSWPSNDELIAMRKSRTLRSIAKELGCSFKAVDRRCKKIMGS